MNKRVRQYIGLISAILAYYVIHEGAHFVYALSLGVFKCINFMGLGVQIDIYREMMTDVQLGIFCISGSVTTLITGYILMLLADRIGSVYSKVFKACMYYITIVLFFIDPLYLSLFYSFFGGGDMNGIALLVPEIPVRMIYGSIFIINVIIFFKIVLPKYKVAFKN